MTDPALADLRVLGHSTGPAAGCTVFQRSDFVVCRAWGEIDIAAAAGLGAATRAIADDVRSVVVNLAEVRFMDSSGLHWLLELDARLSGSWPRLAVLLEPGGQVAQLLNLAGLQGHLYVVPASGEAAFEPQCARRVDADAGRAFALLDDNHSGLRGC